MYIGAADGGFHTLIYSSPALGQSVWLTGTEVVNGSGIVFVPSQQGVIDYGAAYTAKVVLVFINSTSVRT